MFAEIGRSDFQSSTSLGCFHLDSFAGGTRTHGASGANTSLQMCPSLEHMLSSQASSSNLLGASTILYWFAVLVLSQFA
jgi:hypothetical protein